VLRRHLLHLKRIRQRYYYRIKPKEDDRNRAAQNMDLLALTFIFWVVVLVLLGQYFKADQAFSVSLVLAAGGGVAACSVRKKQRQGREFHYRMWSTGQKFREEIKNIKTRDELAAYVALLLKQLLQFEDVRVNKKSECKKLSVDEGVAIYVRDKKGILIAGQCFAPGASGSEEVRYLQSFHNVLRKQELDRAFVATTAPLNPEVRSLLAQLRKKYSITLLDEEKLVELSLQVKRQPETENIQEGTAGGKKLKPSFFNLVLGPQKRASYLFTAGALWCIYLISRPAGVLGIVYAGLIFINVTLALACYILNLKNEETFDLEDLGLKN